MVGDAKSKCVVLNFLGVDGGIVRVCEEKVFMHFREWNGLKAEGEAKP